MAEPLTVVIVVDHATITGGQAKVAFDSAIGLKRAGHRPIVFAAVGPVSPLLEEHRIETVCLGQKDLVGHTIKAVAAVQGVWNGKAARALRDLLAGLPRDTTLVHVHGWAKALSPSIAVPIRRSGLPAVATIHEYFQFCPNGGFYNYQRHHVCGLKPLSAACWATHCDSRNYSRKLWRNARLAVAKRAARLPDVFSHYVAISDFQHAIVAPMLPTDATLLRIDNPVTVPDMGPKADPASGDIVFVGRLSAEKGAFVYAEAARLAGQAPIFIGDGPVARDLRSNFPDARLLGWHDAPAVQATMRAARALVFPSVWYEGQPLTVLEAKGLGTPVIVSDACAGREAIEDGVTGLWFKSQDVGDLARALLAMGDDARVASLSRAAYDAFWRRPPSLDLHVERITALYRQMVTASSRVPSTTTSSMIGQQGAYAYKKVISPTS